MKKNLYTCDVMAAMAMALSACGNSTAEQNTASADVENNAATVTEKKQRHQKQQRR